MNSMQLQSGNERGDDALSGAFQSNAPLDFSHLTGPRKAAVLCIMLGDEVAGDVLKHLTEDEVQLVSKELAAIQHVPTEVSDKVVKEFYDLCMAHSYVASAGLEFAKRLLI